MDSITKMVGVIETALLSIEEITQPSPIDMLYALQDRLEAAETAVGMMAAAVCPALEMSPDDPVGMAHSVVAEVERLKNGLLSEQHENDAGLKWHVLTTRSFDDLVARGESAEAECERLREQVDALRTALAYYVEARNVTNWGMEEDEDIGDVARAALEATA